MVFINPFREEAAAARNKRQRLDDLLQVTAPRERFVVAVTGVVLVVIILWIFFGTITRNVHFEGVLIEQGTRYEVTTLEPGHLLEIQVAPGDHVDAGNPIAKQTVPELDREISALRSRTELLKSQSSESVQSQLETTEIALLELEARSSARSTITSHNSGEVTAVFGSAGDYVIPGTVVALVRTGASGTNQAVAYVSQKSAQGLKAGMSATVEISTPQGSIQRIQGKIAAVTAESVSQWLAALLQFSSKFGYRIDVKFDSVSGLDIQDGTPCRINVQLDQVSPVELLNFSNS